MKILTLLATIFVLFNFAGAVYANGHDDVGSIVATTGAPKISDLIVPVIRTINIILAASGLMFMIMVFWAAYKYSLAQGDPESIKQAKSTLTYAIYGLIVALGSFAIIRIAGGIFGIDPSVGSSAGADSQNAVQELLHFMNNY